MSSCVRISAVSLALLSVLSVSAEAWAHTDAVYLSKELQSCRKTFNKVVGKYLATGLKELAGCYKKGLAGKGPEPADCAGLSTGDTKGKIAGARSKAVSAVAAKCDAGMDPAGLGALDACPWPCDSLGASTDPAGIITCDLCLADATIEELTRATFGQAGPGLSKDGQKCVSSVAKAAGKHSKTVMKTLAKCHEAVDKMKSVADCHDPEENDAKGKVARSRAKLEGKIEKKCTNSVLAGLDLCNGYGAFVTAATACTGDLYERASEREAHTISGSCGFDGSCDLEREDAASCPADCGPLLSPAVAGVFDASCNGSGCHSSGTRAGGLSLQHDEAVDELLGVVSTSGQGVRVVAGEPDVSWLWAKISEATPAVGSQMPLGAGALGASDQAAVRQWIQSGLACGDGICDFASSGETSANCSLDCGPTVPDAVQAVFDANCTTSGCHDGFAAIQNLDLSAPVAGANLVGADSGEIAGELVVAGQPGQSFLWEKISSAVPPAGARMPIGAPALSNADLTTIREWIEGGAPAR